MVPLHLIVPSLLRLGEVSRTVLRLHLGLLLVEMARGCATISLRLPVEILTYLVYLPIVAAFWIHAVGELTERYL